MSSHYRSTARYKDSLLSEHGQEAVLDRLLPDTDNLPRRLPGVGRISARSLELFWHAIGTDAGRGAARSTLLGAETPETMEAYGGNIENFIGTVRLPVGLAGPLRINGFFAQGDFLIPLATTEAALVASYHRGAQLLSEAGGCAAMLLSEGMNRAPGFAFVDLREVGQFVAWALTEVETFRAKAEATTRFGKLCDMKIAVEGNHVYLDFEYTTGDASGQNMVTIATAAICDYIVAESPVKPRYHFVEANISGDKKASARSFLTVRGKKVTAEVVIPGRLIAKRLHTTAKEMEQYWRMSAIGGVMSGTIGIQGHYANGLTALYIASGQDAACIAESAVGVTRFEVVPSGESDTPDNLYASVTLPNLVVGTVGGGTGLPTQRACLDILGLAGPGNACALAEVCAALSLAGELSIIGALAAGDFASAHQRLARSRVKETTPEPDHDHAG